jgi:hypothetical protein
VFRLFATREKQFCGSTTLRWDLQKIKTVTICYMHILTYRTGRHSRNMDKNQSRHQQDNSKLDGTLKCRGKKKTGVWGRIKKLEDNVVPHTQQNLSFSKQCIFPNYIINFSSV